MDIMVELVVCDIDNTIVPKHKTPSERTINCIHEFHNRNILFGLASGRDTQSLRDLAKSWGIHCDILIGNNGGEYQDELTGEHDILPKISRKHLEEIFKIMEPFKDQVNTSMYVNGEHIIRRLDEQTMASFKYHNSGKLPRVVEDESEFWAEDAYKVGFRTPAEIMEQVEKRVAEFKSDVYKGFKTEFTMFEFSRVEADKGKMLVRFCNSHNIDIKNTVAFGDMTNDVSILKAAGLGVCLENGSIDAKQAADVITDLSIEDDGFADYVEKHILNI